MLSYLQLWEGNIHSRQFVVLTRHTSITLKICCQNECTDAYPTASACIQDEEPFKCVLAARLVHWYRSGVLSQFISHGNNTSNEGAIVT